MKIKTILISSALLFVTLPASASIFGPANHGGFSIFGPASHGGFSIFGPSSHGSWGIQPTATHKFVGPNGIEVVQCILKKDIPALVEGIENCEKAGGKVAVKK